MSKVSLLNQYVADLHVINVKLHQLHWNVVGLQFVTIHKFTEELYEDLFKKFDEAAEILKMKGEAPLGKVADYLKVSQVEELDTADYSADFVVKEIKKDLAYLKDLALKIRTAADEEDDFEVANMVEDHISYYSKQLWFLKAMIQA
ncbi:MAG: DNA protection during starvation protein [Lachnoclostridium sp.]|jgi:starvation-inducible DNA-binding protein